MSEKLAYQKMLDLLKVKYNYTIDINEETIEIMNEINNNKISLSENEWEHLINIAMDKTKNLPLLMTIIKSDKLPTNIQQKILDRCKNIEEASLMLISDNIDDSIIQEIYNKYKTGFKDILKSSGMHFSNKTLDYLCFRLSRKELDENLDFLPFKFIRENSKATSDVNLILSSSTADIPEKMAINIASNKNLPDSTRNKAFNFGYDPSLLDNCTEYMIKELYKSFADTAFDIKPETNNEFIAIKNAQQKILSYVKNKQLPESCQIDFIERSQSDASNIDVASDIIRATKYPSVLSLAASIHSDKKIKTAIMANASQINNNTMSELLRTTYPSSLQCSFVNAVLHHPFSEKTIETFINLDELNIKRAIVASYETSCNQVDSVLMDSWEKPYYRELLYLKDLREVCINFVNMKNIQNIINTGVLELMNAEKKSPHKFAETSVVLRHKINTMNCDKWAIMYKNDRNTLIKKLNSMNKTFPEFNQVTKSLIDKIEQSYKDSQFVLKYKDLFDISQPSSERNVPFCNMDIIKFSDMNKERKKEFINDITKVDNKDIVTEILYNLEQFCNQPVCNYDIVAKTMYECNDLCEVLSEIIDTHLGYEENIKTEMDER